MKKVCVFLADGFEEIEGLTVVDILRRAKVEVSTVSIMDTLDIQGAHGINIKADQMFDEADFSVADMLVLPGGMPGTLHLGQHKGLQNILKDFHNEKKNIAAICAAPSVLGKYGILEGKREEPAVIHHSRSSLQVPKLCLNRLYKTDTLLQAGEWEQQFHSH